MSDPPPAASISFRFEPEDYVVLSEILARRPVRRVLVALAIYVALGAFVVLAYGADLTAIPWWVLAVLVIGPLLAVFNVAASGLIARLTYRRNPAAGETMTLTFDDQAIGVDRPTLSSRIAWSNIKQIIETRDHAILAISRREGIPVPRRAFASDTDYAALVRFAQARIAPPVD